MVYIESYTRAVAIQLSKSHKKKKTALFVKEKKKNVRGKKKGEVGIRNIGRGKIQERKRVGNPPGRAL